MEKIRKSLQKSNIQKLRIIKEERNLDLHSTILRANFWLPRTLNVCWFMILAVHIAPNVIEKKAAKNLLGSSISLVRSLTQKWLVCFVTLPSSCLLPDLNLYQPPQNKRWLRKTLAENVHIAKWPTLYILQLHCSTK